MMTRLLRVSLCTAVAAVSLAAVAAVTRADVAPGTVINKANADQVKAQVVVETANYPVTPEADPILAERGITVLPDILASGGGVAVPGDIRAAGVVGWLAKLE